jgi:hypothetical protein
MSGDGERPLEFAKELAHIRREEEKRATTRLQIGAIKIFLTRMVERDDIPQYRISPETRQIFDETYALLVWNSLPEAVTTIDFGGRLVLRENDIPEKEQVTWTFEQIEDYAEVLSKRISDQWQPILKAGGIRKK